MILKRIRCPVCGTRLNQDAIDREIELGDGNDVISQEFGGRANAHTLSRHDFEDEEETRELYDKVKAAYEYLSEILGIDEDEDD